MRRRMHGAAARRLPSGGPTDLAQGPTGGIEKSQGATAPEGPVADPSTRPDQVAGALAFLGAILVGVGVITFVAANHPGLPGWGRLGLITGGMLLAYGLGYWLCFERRAASIGGALLFLGALLFGADLFFVAQGYHLPADD